MPSRWSEAWPARQVMLQVVRIHIHSLHPPKADVRVGVPPSPARVAGTVPTFEGAVAGVQKIRFYAGDVLSRSKMHVTVGHTTGKQGCCGF
jgi:hypothetical protein